MGSDALTWTPTERREYSSQAKMGSLLAAYHPVKRKRASLSVTSSTLGVKLKVRKGPKGPLSGF